MARRIVVAADPLAEAAALRSAGRRDAAAMLARKQLRRGGNTAARALHLLGLIAGDSGRPDRAVQLLTKARTMAPDAPDIVCDLGNALKSAGRLEDAVACHRAVVGLLPRSPLALSNLATALTAAGRPEEALSHLSEAVALAPDDAELRFNLANSRLALDDENGAEEAFLSALARAPGHVAALTNLGALYRRTGRIEEARRVFSTAMRRAPDNPDVRWNLSLALLMAGEFEAGWRAYEARRDINGFAMHQFDVPRWDGCPLGGRTLLVHAEQGLGDCLQFCRYVPRLRSAGGPVLFRVPARLRPLMSPAFREIDIVDDDRAPPRFNLEAPLMSLPHLIGPVAPFWPDEGPYLRPDPERVARWRSRLSRARGPLVAIGWQGNPDYAGDTRRSAPLAAFEPLAAVAGIRLISLQRGAARTQLDALPWRDRIVDLGAEIDRDGAFVDSSAIVSLADAVVTTDTALLHLAGGMGVRTLAALARVPDWRWGLTGEDTAWYPSVHLFRQPSAGDWTTVFMEIARSLSARMG